LCWFERASRPKPAKLHLNAHLRGIEGKDVKEKYSPEQIPGRDRNAVAAREVPSALGASSRLTVTSLRITESDNLGVERRLSI
jgi:hypothetical protein